MEARCLFVEKIIYIGLLLFYRTLLLATDETQNETAGKKKHLKRCVLFFFAVHSRNRMFITLLIGQAVLIILLICALVHWVRKRNKQNSSHSPLDRLDSRKISDGKYAPSKCL